jgi:dihydroneopterin aldolase
MPPDCARLRDIAFYAHIGCDDRERRLGRPVALHADARAGLASAARSGDVKKGVDHTGAYRVIASVQGSREVSAFEAWQLRSPMP